MYLVRLKLILRVLSGRLINHVVPNIASTIASINHRINQPSHQPLYESLHQPLHQPSQSTIAINHCTDRCSNHCTSRSCINHCSRGATVVPGIPFVLPGCLPVCGALLKLFVVHLGPAQTRQKKSEKISGNHQELLLFDKKCNGYERFKNCLKYCRKQTEKRNEKRGSISYAARTAKCSPIQEQPSVPGVSFYVPLGRVIP